jgi:hypothetical protein
MEKVRAHFSVWLAKSVTTLAGRTGISSLIKLMRRLTGTQVTVEQMIAIRNAIKEKPNAQVMVFGVGNDSRFWMNSNLCGRTVFIEDDEFWLKKIQKRIVGIEAYLVNYDTKIEKAKELLNQPEKLIMDFPNKLADVEWDVILVDAPTGWGDGTTGRMKSIFAASKMVKSGHVFVHDCERDVEIMYCDKILKPENFVQEIKATDSGYLRHYRFRG